MCALPVPERDKVVKKMKKEEAGIAERYFTGKGKLWILWVAGNGGSYPLPVSKIPGKEIHTQRNA